MNKKFIKLSLMLVAAVSLTAYQGNNVEQSATPAAITPPLPVHTITIKQQLFPETVQAMGQAEGSQEVEVRARVSGILERKLYQEGAYIEAGKPLFQMERAPYEIAVQRTKATLTQRQAQLEQTRREAQRLQPLAREKAVAQREYDDAATNARLAEAAVDAARAELREAELNLSYTAITAPVSGVSGRAHRSSGALITAGGDSLLTTVVQTDPIWVRCSISEAELAKLRAAATAQVNLLGEDGTVQLKGGRLNFAGSMVDAQTGAVQVRATFANAQLTVLPGQLVRVQFLTDAVAACAIPQTAVMQDEDGHKAWVVRDGKAVAVPIKTGPWLGQQWVVREGLAAGDQVIVDNLIKLSPGTPVQPQSAISPDSLPR